MIRAPLHRRAVAFVAVGLSLAAFEASAQIVNVQPLLAQEPHPGFAAALEGSLDLRKGNTDLMLVSGMALARYHRGRHLLFALVRGDLGLKTGQTFTNRDLEHLRYRVNALRGLDFEAFGQHDRDEFRRLALRVVGGGGPRLQVVGAPWIDLAVAASYMLEFERLRAGTEPDAGQETLAHRLSCYAVLSVRIDDRFRFAHTVYVQPRLTRLHDVRMLSESELLVAITRHFSWKSTFTLLVDSEPPSGVQPLDTAVKSSLQISY